MNRDELFTKVTEISTKMKLTNILHLNKRRQIQELTEQIKIYSRGILVDITNEVDATTQKKIFTNDVLRKSELDTRLENDPMYQTLNSDCTNLTREVEDLEILLSSWRYEFRTYEIYAQFTE